MSFSEKFNIFKKYVAWFLLISSAISAAAAALIVLWPGGAVGGSPFPVLTLLARIGFSFFVTGLLLLIHTKKTQTKINEENNFISNVAIELSRSGIPSRVNGKNNILIFYGENKRGSSCSAVIDFKEMRIYFKMNESAHEYDCGISFYLNAKDISNYIKKVIDGNVIPPNDRVANASNLSGWAYGESLAESCSNRIIREEVVLKFSAIDTEINKACADPQLASLGFMSGMASAEKQGLIVQLYSDSLDDIYYCPRGFRPELIEWDDGVVRNDLRPL